MESSNSSFLFTHILDVIVKYKSTLQWVIVQLYHKKFIFDLRIMITPLVSSNSTCPLNYDLVSSSFSYHLVSIMMFSLHLIRSKHNYVEYIINHCIIYLYTILWFLNIIWMKYDIEVFKNYKKERKIHTDETSFKWYSVNIPPANKVWGGVYRNHHVRPSVCPSVHVPCKRNSS